MLGRRWPPSPTVTRCWACWIKRSSDGNSMQPLPKRACKGAVAATKRKAAASPATLGRPPLAQAACGAALPPCVSAHSMMKEGRVRGRGGMKEGCWWPVQGGQGAGQLPPAVQWSAPSPPSASTKRTLDGPAAAICQSSNTASWPASALGTPAGHGRLLEQAGSSWLDSIGA
jgi:hypothetical protein